ncbi:hypothetical protein B566_EDAN010140 [Ephemera danica]|nr:hypothetical protein B566_EDAN010140 [Ephemera danica]
MHEVARLAVAGRKSRDPASRPRRLAILRSLATFQLCERIETIRTLHTDQLDRSTCLNSVIGPRGATENQKANKHQVPRWMVGFVSRSAATQINTSQEKHTPKFTGFMLSVEPLERRTATGSDVNVGSFQLYNDALTKFSERCPNTVTQTSSMPKPEIQILWTAPSPGVGCLVFSRKLCEDVQESLDEQPQIIDPCCACDEAKYELTFEGLWSRHTHPKDFPRDLWVTRFSDVIGASHTADYRFWEYGGFASEGLRQVAEKGSTRMLESELKAESDKIRTIIKARGISYPNITGKTFGLFRVNRRHHLISVVSMIDPSPDWIVGVSALELCLRNCSWVDSKVLNLYPWDAGTDSGVSYISPDSPTTPRDSIRRITSSFPNDPKSPFYDPTGEEMKPLARLYLTRQRLYEKSCAEEIQHSFEETEVESVEQDCKVSEWTEWSQCSATCGRGFKTRQRYYINQIKAGIDFCERQLIGKAPCVASHPSCPDVYGMRIVFHSQSKDYSAASENPVCSTSDWSAWSSCSVTCGVGVRTRSRWYNDQKQARKICHAELEQTEPCVAPDECPSGPQTEDQKGLKQRTRLFQMPNVPSHLQDQCNLNMVEQVHCQAELPDCDLGPEDLESICQLEKDVGPCRGYMIRWYFDSTDRECRQFAYGTCKGNRNNFETREDCEKACAGLKDLENGTISGISSDSHTKAVYPPNVVSTRAPVTANIGYQVDCQVSVWSEWSTCSATCGRGWKSKWRKILIHPKNGGRPCPPRLMKRRKCKGQYSCDSSSADQPTWGDMPGVGSLVRVHPGEWPQQADMSEEELTYGTLVAAPSTGADCVLSAWGPWSPCSQSCGPHAVQQRTRSVISHPWGDGLPCGPRLQRRSCALLPCQR